MVYIPQIMFEADKNKQFEVFEAVIATPFRCSSNAMSFS